METPQGVSIQFSSLTELFKCNLSAFCFKFCFDVFSFCFGCAFFKSFRSTVNYCFSFFQSKTGNFTNNFDNFYFVRSNFCKFYVELIFFFSCFSSCSSCCYYNTCCCGNAELFLTLLQGHLTLIQIIL